jgi:hypothetical protein
MGAKMHTTKKINLATGSQATGKTIPGPGSVRGGGTATTGKSGSKTPSAGGGYGNARGLQKGKGGC